MHRVELLRRTQRYYLESESAYHNWGRDLKREGVYALHTGYSEGEERNHHEEVKELEKRLIAFAEIPPEGVILDAGCGAGSLSFEIKSLYLRVRIYGVNISLNQLESAERHRNQVGIGKMGFLLQDFHHLAFSDNTFDRALFCESFIHSDNKLELAREVFRVLKPGGKLVMSDTFMKRLPENLREKDLLEDLKTGWYLPSLVTLKGMERLLLRANFGLFSFCDLTPNILPSAKIISQSAEENLGERLESSEIIYLSRKASVACGRLYEGGVLRYCFLSAVKPSV